MMNAVCRSLKIYKCKYRMKKRTLLYVLLEFLKSLPTRVPRLQHTGTQSSLLLIAMGRVAPVGDAYQVGGRGSAINLIYA